MSPGRVREESREAADERIGSFVEVLPVRIGREHRKVRQGGDGIPVADPVGPVRQWQQADRVLAPLRRDVRAHLAEEIHDGLFTERLHLWSQARRQIYAGKLGTHLTRASPAFRLCADVLGHRLAADGVE